METRRRGQQDIIVTILLILVALAAIGAIAYFIVQNVREGTQTAENKAECLKVTLAIDKINTTSIVISRQNDDVEVTSLKLYLDGVNQNKDILAANIPAKLDSKTVLHGITPVSAGQTVRMNPVLSSGYICENAAEAIVVAAA